MDPGYGDPHVLSVSPCESCSGRSDGEWKWGRCTTPNEADATLIASAPELLEAAQFVLAYLNGHKCINNEEQRAVLEVAIAKATGGQP